MLKSALSAQKTPHEALAVHEKPGKELGTFFLCMVEVRGETQSFQSGSDYPLAKS